MKILTRDCKESPLYSDCHQTRCRKRVDTTPKKFPRHAQQRREQLSTLPMTDQGVAWRGNVVLSNKEALMYDTTDTCSCDCGVHNNCFTRIETRLTTTVHLGKNQSDRHTRTKVLHQLITNNREEEPKKSDGPQTESPRSSAHVGAWA